MNKMSDEEKIDLTDDEKIELIQQRLKNTKFSQQYTNAPKISLSYILDMETLLELYHKEKEKNIKLDREIKKRQWIKVKDNGEIEPLFYISKDKIINKIKELKKRYENEKGALGLRYSESGFIMGQIIVLEELLKEG